LVAAYYFASIWVIHYSFYLFSVFNVRVQQGESNDITMLSNHVEEHSGALIDSRPCRQVVSSSSAIRYFNLLT